MTVHSALALALAYPDAIVKITYLGNNLEELITSLVMTKRFHMPQWYNVLSLVSVRMTIIWYTEFSRTDQRVLM